MTDTSIFNIDETTIETSKYSTWEADALRKKAEAADEHIRTLEAENAQFKANMNQTATIEEVLKRLDRVNQPPSNYTPTTPATTPAERTNSEQVTKAEVATLVTATIEQEQKKALAKANVENIARELKKVWGEGFATKLTEKTKEMGIKQSFLEDMAENYPQAFLKLVLEDKAPTTNPNVHVPPSSVNAPGGANTFIGETYKDFKKAMKDNPNLRHDPAFNRRMHEAAQKLGDSFFK